MPPSTAGIKGGGPQSGLLGPGSQSTSRSILPDFRAIQNAFGGFQGGIDSNQLQNRAVQEQLGLRGRLDSLISQQGEGERGRINQDFQTAARNATGGLQSRGFAGSSLNIPAQLGVERERGLAIGDLNDRLLSQRIGADSSVTKNISDLLFGSSGQATDLISSLLGSAGIGSDSSSITATGGGGSGGNTTGDVSNIGAGGEPFDGRFSGGGGSGGGGSGGGGSGGGGSGGGGGGQVISNPFFGESGGGGVPLEEQELEPDQGPLQTPDAFKRNKERIAAREKAKLAEIAEIFGGGGDALAQSAAGTAGAIAAGGSLA